MSVTEISCCVYSDVLMHFYLNVFFVCSVFRTSALVPLRELWWMLLIFPFILSVFTGSPDLFGTA